MSIVVITILGSSKMAFANSLHQVTGGAIELVIVQKWKPDSYGSRLSRLGGNGIGQFIREAWSALLLRLQPKTRKTLEYFRDSSVTWPSNENKPPKMLLVESIDSPEVLDTLKKISPDLLVVWGSKILKPDLLATAKRAVNLHIGQCPHYRGTLANQCAVLDGNISQIGATVHYVSEHVDAGGVISIVKPDLKKSPRDMLRDLNDRAQTAYIDIIARLHKGENIPATSQDEKKGKNLRLKDWTPYVRYKVAKQMRKLEREYDMKNKKTA